MPPARPPLASQPIFRLNATLVFKQTEYRGAQRIYAQLVDSRQRKWDKVWLSLDDPLARLEAIMSFYSLSPPEIDEAFKAALLDYRAGDNDGGRPRSNGEDQSGSKPCHRGARCASTLRESDHNLGVSSALPATQYDDDEEILLDTNDGDDLKEVARELFAELEAATCMDPSTSRATAATTCTAAAAPAPPLADLPEPPAADAARELEAAPKRQRKAPSRLDPAIAERGGGGWGKYALHRCGSRHGRVREQTYGELRADVAKLKEQLEAILELVKPDRSFNGCMERLAAVLLLAAEVEGASATATAEGVLDAGASGGACTAAAAIEPAAASGADDASQGEKHTFLTLSPPFRWYLI